MSAFAFPAWAAVLFGNKPAAPARPDLPTVDAPTVEPLVEAKRKRGRPVGTKLSDQTRARMSESAKQRGKGG